MAWNRLESRPRKKQFDSVLKAGVYDPFWMLGRQWQMGEFKCNDTGSGILARVQMDYTMMTGVASYGGAPVAYAQDLPLEPVVESVPYNWSEKERILMGKKWFFFLQQHSLSLTVYKPLFDTDPLTEVTIDMQAPTSAGTETLIQKKASVFSNRALVSFLDAANLADMHADGGKIYKLITGGTLLSNIQARYLAANSVAMSSGDVAAFNATISDYQAWVEKMYTLPAPGTPQGSWDDRTMEYKFDAFVPNEAATEENCITADRYHQGHFDWYAFTQAQTSYTPAAPAVTESKWLQLIMTESRFAGMPSSRWWEFENGAVNFTQLDGNTTDIAKIILTQFALVYQDDWFTIPYKIPVGSYARTQGIVVTDVFGVKTFVPNYRVKDYNPTPAAGVPAFTQDADGWRKWNWMEISQSTEVINEMEPTHRMLVLPVVNNIQESKPLDSVLFMRDEMADMVWAIEKKVPDGLGKGKDGYEAAKDYVAYLKLLKPAPAVPAVPVDPNVKLTYELASTDIPENWIPFIPVHTGSSNRSIQLQRASMPRILDPYLPSLVRPRSQFLRTGLDGASITPLFLNEEEVTRASTILETSIQRTRWYDGKVVMWVGRRKYTGRGEGSSGLSFDNVKDQ